MSLPVSVVTIAGAGPGEEKEDEDDEEVPENAWWAIMANSPLCMTVADHHGNRCCGTVAKRVQALLFKHSSWLNVAQWPPKGPQTLCLQLTMKISYSKWSDNSFLAASWSIHSGESVLQFY